MTAILGAQDQVRDVIGTPNNQHRIVNTYPEYWVDGKPFFAHIANFNYYRIPRDRWPEELVRLQSMGINTLDILPMWNWHQPAEDVFDFNGTTNPRRDLDYLMRLSQLMGFKVVLRPGPYDTNDLRNGGYPDWLLRRPEYHMTEQTILEGRYPRLSAIQYERQEETATGWLNNETHLKYSREWFRNVLERVRPLLADQGGPIIGIQLDDDVAIGLSNYTGPNFWKYMDLLRNYAKEATHGSPIPYFIDAADMRVNAEAGDATSEPIWNMGQDYQILWQGAYSDPFEGGKNKFLTETLKTQPLFVPAHVEFQAGWRIHSRDNYAPLTHPTNTLMATRVMFQNGLKGLGYFPVHDTLDAAGYDMHWTNHHYGFESAVNYGGVETSRAVYVRRNGRLIQGIGTLLAATHLLADAGVVYPMATFPQAELTPSETSHVGDTLARVLWSGVYDRYNLELVDSDHTPEENFKRYEILLLCNLVKAKDDLKLYPHLEKYSEIAQQRVQQYVAAGGTLVVFPSLPRGDIFDRLFSPLGSSEETVGDTDVRFSDGSSKRILERRYVLKVPERTGGEVKVFARDDRGGLLGASISFGKGRVLYFGGDFSLWAVPRGSGLSNYRTGLLAESVDYPEATRQAARGTLSSLLKEAGVLRKVDYESVPKKARDPELYVSELVGDWGSRSFESRVGEPPGYGFVGVTNFSTEEAYSRQIQVTDPREEDRSGTSRLRLPVLTVPARESVMLPIRLPLRNPYWKMAPGLEAEDEVYYATSELSRVSYDGSRLELEFTAPTDGEVALRLAGRPRSARVDGEPQRIAEDAKRHLWIVQIPKGREPHYVRKLELEYPRGGVRVVIDGAGAWISGREHVVHVRVENPGGSAFEGTLEFTAGAISNGQSQVVSMSAGGTKEYSFVVTVPDDAVENQVVELQATLRKKGSTASWGWQSQITLHHAFTFSVTPFTAFPMREDLSIPIVHPVLVSMNLPGEAHFAVKVKNWSGEKERVTLACRGGEGLSIDGASTLELAGNAEGTAELRVAPKKGTGVYRFTIDLKTDSYQASEGVVLAAIEAGEAVAYTLDYDRDGFDDVILENQKVRMYLSPFAGGQAYGFVLKDTNDNAFDSVGDLRDNFSRRVAPEDSIGLSDWNSIYRGLFNRPYSFNIVSEKGKETLVELEYFAPDIYPQGVEVKRTLSLSGDENLVEVVTRLKPRGLAQPQSYVLENSVPFRAMDGPNYNQWFCLPETQSPQEFVPMKDVALPLKEGVVGTVNKRTGETFALMVLSPTDVAQLSMQNHSALIRLTYPSFKEANHPYSYRVAYYWGTKNVEDVQNLFAVVKSQK